VDHDRLELGQPLDRGSAADLVDGEIASKVAPLSEPTHSPAMNIR
jgi:hypothetical protein